MPAPLGKLATKTPQFLEPKPIRKRNPKVSWIDVQKSLLTTWRPEKLLRSYQTLLKHEWGACGLAIQLRKQLIRRKGEAWLKAQQKENNE